MADKTETSLLQRVRASLPNLSPAERKLGEFLCDFPGEIASYNALELARLAKVSRATVSRFVRSIGFESYEQARVLAREESRTGSRLFLDRSKDTTEGDWTDAELEQISKNLAWTFRRLERDQLLQAAHAMLGADRVYIFGFRSSYAFASYLRWQLMQVVETISLVPGGGETLGEHVAGLGTGDVAVVFALRRRVTITDELIRKAKDAGAQVFLITDEGADPRVDVDLHIRCQTQSNGPIFNHTSVMAMCHRLLSLTIDEAGNQGRARLQKIESLNDAFSEL